MLLAALATMPRPARSLAGGRIAVKKDPELWDWAKDETCAAEGLCDHSARKMQRATAIYQEHGGRYEGPKRRDNSLSMWAEEEWQTSDGSPSRGRKRYLPKKAWDELTPAQKRRADRTKREGTQAGRQYVRNTRAAAAASRRARRGR